MLIITQFKNPPDSLKTKVQGEAMTEDRCRSRRFGELPDSLFPSITCRTFTFCVDTGPAPHQVMVVEGQASEGKLPALSAGQGGCGHGGIPGSTQAEGGETSRAGPPPGHLQEVLCG